MPYRIAIAGLGKCARTIHLPAYKRIAALEIVGGCDPALLQSQFAFPLFSSIQEMLNATKPHILAVATPPDTHFSIAKLGLESDCHVFCEKPFMNDLSETDAIIALSKQRNKQVVVNNQFRCMQIHRAAKEKIGSAEFGKLLFVSMHQTFLVTEKTEAGWRGEDTRRTTKEFGTHVFDLCRFFFGEEPLSVCARMPRFGQPNGPDYLNLIQLEFSGDRVAHITLDRVSRGRHRYLDVRLDGEFASIETTLGGRLETRIGVRAASRRPFFEIDLAPGGRARLYEGEQYSTLATEPLNVFAGATANLMTEFLAALDRGQTPPCNALDNRHTLELMLACYESDAKRAPVMLRQRACN